MYASLFQWNKYYLVICQSGLLLCDKIPILNYKVYKVFFLQFAFRNYHIFCNIMCSGRVNDNADDDHDYYNMDPATQNSVPNTATTQPIYTNTDPEVAQSEDPSITEDGYLTPRPMVSGTLVYYNTVTAPRIPDVYEEIGAAGVGGGVPTGNSQTYEPICPTPNQQLYQNAATTDDKIYTALM